MTKVWPSFGGKLAGFPEFPDSASWVRGTTGQARWMVPGLMAVTSVCDHDALLDLSFKAKPMRIKYFSATDTALLEFGDRPVAETVGICDDIHVDIDDKGRLVSMTIEHAKDSAGFSVVQLEGIGRS
jgi:uncharacterized protein YuzE